MGTRTFYNVIVVTSCIVLLLGCSNGGDNNGGDGNGGDDNTPRNEVTLSTPDSFLQFFNQYDEPGLEAVTYAQAYYAAIDPGNKRDTLDKFISHHANDGRDWIHVIFRDTQDLGYGRDMYLRNHNNAHGCPEIAFYVRNFVVAPVPGFDYGPLNLDAAIKNDTKYHFGTNAIEVSRADDDVACTGPRFLKFFTYAPTGERVLFADLDDRGVKAMPQICVSCHGGILRPLDSNRNYTTTYADDTGIGDTKSRLMPFSVDTFEFSNTPGFTRADIEHNLKIMNDTVVSTYVATENPPGSSAGEWQGRLPARFCRDITRIPPLGSRLKRIFLTSSRTVGNRAWERGGQPILIGCTAKSSVTTALSVMRVRVQISVQIVTPCQLDKGEISISKPGKNSPVMPRTLRGSSSARVACRWRC